MTEFGETTRDHTEIVRRAEAVRAAKLTKMQAGAACGILSDDDLDAVLPDSRPYSRRGQRARAHAQEG